MSLVRNEQAKLAAGALDRASTACFTIGIATPLAGYLYNVADFQNAVSPWRMIVGIGGWIVAAFVLHILAQRVLRRLE